MECGSHINAVMLAFLWGIAINLIAPVAAADSGYAEIRQDRVLVTLNLSPKSVRAGKRVTIYRSLDGKRARAIKKVAAKRRIRVRDMVTNPGLYEYRYKNRAGARATSFAAIQIADLSDSNSMSVDSELSNYQDTELGDWFVDDIEIDLDGGSEQGEDPAVAPVPVTPTPTPFPKPASPCPESLRRELFALTNAARKSEGLNDLERSAELELAADVHSERMRKAGAITHDLWLEEILGAGFVLGGAAQNVAGPAFSSAQAFDVLLKSPLHRSNILDPRSTLLGVGCTVDNSNRIWWTQNFGRSMSSAAR